MKIAVIVSDASGYAHAGLGVVRIVKTFDMPQEIKDYFNANEADNDALLAEFPWGKSHIGAPVWHLHESLGRLERLAFEYPRICFGSSGEYAQIGTKSWWQRMAGAMNVVCDKAGRPICKLHGLRMLDPDIFTRFPFASADSTNIAQNIGIDSAWRGTYLPPNKEARAAIMRERIESQQSAIFWNRKQISIQTTMFLGEAA